jgi:hypothetical protein
VARTVFIVEDEELGPSFRDGIWLTGRFSASLEGEDRVLESAEGLSIEDALAWGRERAPQVIVRHGDDPFEEYSAGSVHHPDRPRWPPAELPSFVRRRHPADRWRDRADTDPPIPWRVTVLLVPPISQRSLAALREHRDTWSADAERIAERAGAVEWGADQLDTFIADLAAAERRGARGWSSYGSLNLHAVLRVDAPTAARAAEAAAARLELPAGWRATPDAEPLEEPSS